MGNRDDPGPFSIIGLARDLYRGSISVKRDYVAYLRLVESHDLAIRKHHAQLVIVVCPDIAEVIQRLWTDERYRHTHNEQAMRCTYSHCFLGRQCTQVTSFENHRASGKDRQT